MVAEIVNGNSLTRTRETLRNVFVAFAPICLRNLTQKKREPRNVLLDSLPLKSGSGKARKSPEAARLAPSHVHDRSFLPRHPDHFCVSPRLKNATSCCHFCDVHYRKKRFIEEVDVKEVFLKRRLEEIQEGEYRIEAIWTDFQNHVNFSGGIEGRPV
jgi:hypothetical protein